jgi:hypothetical protein
MSRALRYVRVRVLRGFCLGAGRDVYPGDTIELESTRAALKAHEGFVKLIEDDNDDETAGKDSGRPAGRGATSKEGRK